MRSILFIIMISAIVICVVYITRLVLSKEEDIENMCSKDEPCESCICGRKIGNTL